MHLAATAPALDAPDVLATNAAGRLTRAQRRAIDRDLFAENWKRLAGSVGGIIAGLITLRILLPVMIQTFPQLIDGRLRGVTPLTIGGVTLDLPLGTMLRWFLFLFMCAFGLIALVQGWKILRFLFERHRLLHGSVRSVVGEVRLLGTLPLTIFGGRLARPWDDSALVSLSPGTYRFYLIPRADWLLSAQRLPAGMSPTPEEAEVADRYSLTALNGLDRDALLENRAGRLTANQIRWLRRSAPSIGPGTLIPFGVLALGGFGIAIGAGMGVIHNGAPTDQLKSIAGGLFIAAIFIGLIIKQFIDHARQYRDADDGQVASYEGVVGKWEGWADADASSTHWIYLYTYPGGNFKVSREAYRALAEGLPHRLYWTPRSKRLVNIELL